MTGHELLALASAHPQAVGLALGAPVLAAAALQASPPLARPRGALAVAWSVIVYAACVPGIMAATMLAYVVIFQRQDLMSLELVSTFGPLVTMTATLMLAGRKVAVGELPGVDRLSGFLIMLGATFFTLIILEKMRLFMVFHGSIWSLFGLAAVIFLVFKFGAGRLVGRRREPLS